MADSLHHPEAALRHAFDPAKWSDLTVLVAVSGGPDSVALVRALVAVRQPGPGRLVLAHFNHRLRGAEANEDETFVIELARELACEAVVGHADQTTAEINQSNLPQREELARDQRYQFLTRAAGQSGARYLLTAHTADDQAETVLHRIIRGTGLAGLAGIPKRRPLSEATTLIRPWLGVTRSEIMAYLAALGQPYRTDSSNASTAPTRNRLRVELIPHLAEAYNPSVKSALLQLAAHAAETRPAIDRLVEDLRRQCVLRTAPALVEVDCERLAGAVPLLVRELLLTLWREQGWPEQAMGFDEWKRIAAMAQGDAASEPQAAASPEKQVFPGGVVCARVANVLRLDRPTK